MAFDVMGYLTFKLDNLIVGWYLGAAVLGFYDKAYQFLLMPVTQITLPLSNVVHATLSRLQTEPDRFRAYLERALLLATSLGMPLTAFLYGNAATIIEQLLGARWLPSLPIFEALAPAAFVMTITSCVGWISLALGRARRQLPWTAAATAATVGAFLIGVHWGAVGVAAAFSIARVGLLVPTLRFTCAGTRREVVKPAGDGGPAGIREHCGADDLDARHGRIGSLRVDAPAQRPDLRRPLFDVLGAHSRRPDAHAAEHPARGERWRNDGSHQRSASLPTSSSTAKWAAWAASAGQRVN